MIIPSGAPPLAPPPPVAAPQRERPGRDVAQRLFEVSDELLGSMDPLGRFTALSPAWERVLGFTRAELMTQPWIGFVHAADRDATAAHTQASASDAGLRCLENRVATKDGGWRWLAWQFFLDGDGLDLVAHDVTARVAEQQRTNMVSHIVAGIDDAILTKTTDGIVTSWNLAAEWLYGYTAQEAIGRSMLDLIVPPELAHEPAEIVDRLLVGEGVRQYATQRRHKDGTMLTVALTASLLRDEDRGVLGVAVVTRDTAELNIQDENMRGEIDTLVWVGRIRDAIDDGRIVFHAQPIVSLRGDPTTFELLCRMVGRDGEMIAPGRFLPVAERYGLIEELDLLAVDEGARQISRGHPVSINLSTATVGRRHIVDVIDEKLRRAGADPSCLTIEITETALMKDINAAQWFAAAVAGLGCRLALDDFGTGFGGFTYLKKLDIDRLKIDVEFVRDVSSSRASQHVVEAVVSLAKGFGLDTVAEGVEDDRSYALLKTLGVTHVQGYHFGRPGPIDDVVAPASRRDPAHD